MISMKLYFDLEKFKIPNQKLLPSLVQLDVHMILYHSPCKDLLLHVC